MDDAKSDRQSPSQSKPQQDMDSNSQSRRREYSIPIAPHRRKRKDGGPPSEPVLTEAHLRKLSSQCCDDPVLAALLQSREKKRPKEDMSHEPVENVRDSTKAVKFTLERQALFTILHNTDTTPQHTEQHTSTEITDKDSGKYNACIETEQVRIPKPKIPPHRRMKKVSCGDGVGENEAFARWLTSGQKEFKATTTSTACAQPLAMDASAEAGHVEQTDIAHSMNPTEDRVAAAGGIERIKQFFPCSPIDQLIAASSLKAALAMTPWHPAIEAAKQDQVSAQGRKDSTLAKKNSQQRKRGSPWIANKDIPKGDPDRFKSTWDPADDVSVGWKTRSGDAADNENPVQDPTGLVDWSGNMQYPAIDRPAREAISGFERADIIVKYAKESNEALEGIDTCISLDEYQSKAAQDPLSHQNSAADVQMLHNSIVPAFWKPITIDGKSADYFFKTLMESTEIRPIDSGDLVYAKAWWTEFPPHLSAFIQHHYAPVERGVGPGESLITRGLRELDKGSDSNAKQYLEQKKLEQAKKENGTAPIDNKDEDKDEDDEAEDEVDPKAYNQARDLEIRAARHRDMEQLTEIINNFITGTKLTRETVPYTVEVFTRLWINRVREGLPTLVACKRISSDSTEELDASFGPPVYGFMYLDHYLKDNDLYSVTKRAEVWVRDEFTDKGISDCLLDKMLKIVYPRHKEMTDCATGRMSDGVTPWEDYVRPANLIVEYVHDEDRKQDLTVVDAFFLKFRFGLVGELGNIGERGRKRIDLRLYQRKLRPGRPDRIIMPGPFMATEHVHNAGEPSA